MVGQLFGKTASIRSLARTTYLSSEHEWTYGKLRNAILHRKGYSFLEEEDHLSQSLVAISLTVIDYLLFKSLSWSPWFSWINAWPFLLLLFLRTFISSVSLSIISEREKKRQIQKIKHFLHLSRGWTFNDMSEQIILHHVYGPGIMYNVCCRTS